MPREMWRTTAQTVQVPLKALGELDSNGGLWKTSALPVSKRKLRSLSLERRESSNKVNLRILLFSLCSGGWQREKAACWFTAPIRSWFWANSANWRHKPKASSASGGHWFCPCSVCTLAVPRKGGDDGLLIRDKLFWFAVFSSLQQTTVDLIFPIFTSLPQKLDFSQATAITATTRWKFLSLLYLVLFLVSVFFFKIILFFFNWKNPKTGLCFCFIWFHFVLTRHTGEEKDQVIGRKVLGWRAEELCACWHGGLCK